MSFSSGISIFQFQCYTPGYAGENGKSYAVVFMKKLLWYIGNSVDSVTNIRKEQPYEKKISTHGLGM
jgi:hypothetical protein